MSIRPTRFAVLFLAGSLWLSAHVGVCAESAESLLQKANAAADRKDWNAALTALDAILARDKNNVDAYVGKSIVLLQKSDTQGALAALDRVIELDPKRTDALRLRAGLYQKMGEEDAAKGDFVRVLALVPAERDKLAATAQKATDEKSWDKAYNLWGLLSEAVPNEARGHYGVAFALFNSFSAYDYVTGSAQDQTLYDKTLADADAQYDAAIKADPKFVPAYLGRVEKKIGERSTEEYASDLALLDNAIGVVPGNAALYFARASLSDGLPPTDNLLQDRVADFTRALQFDPKLAPALVKRAWDYHLQKQDALALDDCARALALQPDDVRTLANRAEIYGGQGNWQLSAADYERAVALSPTDTLLAFRRYSVLTHLPDSAKALDAISALLVSDPGNALYLRSRAETYLLQKDTAHALADVDAALALAPTDANTAQLRARIVAASAPVKPTPAAPPTAPVVATTPVPVSPGAPRVTLAPMSSPATRIAMAGAVAPLRVATKASLTATVPTPRAAPRP